MDEKVALRQASPAVKFYLDAFVDMTQGAISQEPKWLSAIRKHAISRFSQMGLPTNRRGNEAWKYTDITPITKKHFELPLINVGSSIRKEEVEHFSNPDFLGHRLVFLDGYYRPDLSTDVAPPAGLKLSNIEQSIRSMPELMSKSLASYADFESEPFTALNTALYQDGAVVHISKGYQQNQPVELLFLSGQQGTSVVSHPRVLVLAEEGSNATVVETYASLSDEQYFTNSVAEVLLGPGAHLRHYRIQNHTPRAFHIATTHVEQGPDSTFSSFSLDVGGNLVRNNLNIRMSGEGSSCTLNGLYLAKGDQHVDNQISLDHAGSYTTSRQLYKGVLDGKSHGVFQGSILVRPNTKKVDAQQTDKNLLLSDQAEIDTKPALWIYSDDVKCGHGAASGTIDQEALFYLRSRGLDEPSARRILIGGFVGETINTIEDECLRTYIEKLVMENLQGI
jgi:Fe-S cluster assembly protein SufD